MSFDAIFNFLSTPYKFQKTLKDHNLGAVHMRSADQVRWAGSPRMR